LAAILENEKDSPHMPPSSRIIPSGTASRTCPAASGVIGCDCEFILVT